MITSLDLALLYLVAAVLGVALCRSLKLPTEVAKDTGLGFVNSRNKLQDSFRGRVLFHGEDDRVVVADFVVLLAVVLAGLRLDVLGVGGEAIGEVGGVRVAIVRVAVVAQVPDRLETVAPLGLQERVYV